jgi:gliding motility-associated-like protein/uncharacterized repeat protein (TIGR01451 family)
MRKSLLNFCRIFISIFCILFFANYTYSQEKVQVSINSGNPAFPFPQFLEYKAGKTLAKYNAEGVTHADMEKAMRDGWQVFANEFIYTGEVQDGVRYIRGNIGCPYDCTEGAGYSMLGAAYMADKATFDGLWMRTHDHFVVKDARYQDGTIHCPNYDWGVYSLAEACDQGTAGDGDWDVGLALLMAYKQWGTKSGVTVRTATGTKEMNYFEEAKKIISAFVDTTRGYTADGQFVGFNSGSIGHDGYPKGGNKQNEATTWNAGGKPLKYNSNVMCGDNTGNCPANYSFASYIAPAYYHSFSEFLASNDGTEWCIEQYRRAEASTSWLMKQVAAQDRLPYLGGFLPNSTGVDFAETDPAQGKADGESFRMAWRTILDGLWRGNGRYIWDPATHTYTLGSQDYMKQNADNVANFLRDNGICAALGSSPDPVANTVKHKGVAQIRQYHLSDGTSPSGNWTNYTLGSSAPAVALHGDTELTAQIYRQLELKWDDKNTNLGVNDTVITESTPKYFHGWFRLLGMLTLTGNLHAPENMVPVANMKVYLSTYKDMDKDTIKTFAFVGDEVIYEVSYRNYGSLDANNVSISIPIPDQYEIVNTGGGTISGGNLVFNTGTVPGFKSSTGINPTKGSYVFTVKVKSPKVVDKVCLVANITCSNGSGWTSNEYPNFLSYKMSRNCVDILGERSLKISKTANRTEVNPGMEVEFTLDFSNTSDAGWLNGGRKHVNFSYAYSESGPNSYFHLFRNWNNADEAYIDLSNYRVSFYMFDNVNKGIYSAANPTGWALIGKNLQTGELADFDFKGEKIPVGDDNGKKWDQRLMIRFPPDITAPTHTVLSHLNNRFQLHKGTLQPIWYSVQMESTPPSPLFSGRIGDDWSFKSTSFKMSIGSGAEPYFLIGPNYADPNNPVGVVMDRFDRDACTSTFGPDKIYDKILVEEWDGYTWRRVAGEGPMPGREMYNVVVIDTLPADFKFVKFTDDIAEGIQATMTTSGGREIIRWSMPKVLVGMTGDLKYVAVAQGTCPGMADKDVINTAWIYSDTDSPLRAADTVKLTCGFVAEPVAGTTMTKKADKTSYLPTDNATYTIDFEQTLGTKSNPPLDDASRWTAIDGSDKPAFTASAISFDNGKSGQFVRENYSHGKNGTLIIDVDHDGEEKFGIALRYTGGNRSGGFQGIFIEFQMAFWGSMINMKVFENTSSTPIDEIVQEGYAAPFTEAKIKIELKENVLKIWINELTGLPFYTFSGITVLSPGYVGFAQGDRSASSSVWSKPKINGWNAHFDSAFDLEISDPLPTELTFVSATDGGTFAGGKVTWPKIAGPMLYGETLQYTLVTNVASCDANNKVINKVFVNLFGSKADSVASQSISSCGSGGVTPPTCIPPVSVTVSSTDPIICLGSDLTINGTVSPANSNYYYTWFKDGSAVSVPSKTYTPFSKAATVAGDEGIYTLRVEDGNAGDASCYKESVGITITINAPVDTAVISSDQTICTGTIPALLGGLAATGGSATATASYTWEKSTVSPTGPWSIVNAAVSKDYTPGILTATTYFRRNDKKGVCDSVPSNVVTITVPPALVAGTISGDQTICSNSVPDPINSTTPASGGTGVYEYQWQSSVDNIVFADILGATDVDFIPVDAISENTYYRRKVVSGTMSPCNENQTSSVLVTVGASVVPSVSITADDTTICAGTLVTFTAKDVNGGTLPTFEWFVNDVSQEAASTLKTFVKASLADGDIVKVKMVNSSGCASSSEIFSPEIEMQVFHHVDPEITIQATSEEICSGDLVNFSIAYQQNEGLNPNYQWFVGAVLQVGETGASFSSSTLNDGDQIKAILSSDAACLESNDVESNVIVMKVSSNLNPNVFIAADPVGDTVVCAGETVKFKVTGAVATGTNPLYQWYINGSAIVGEVDSVFTTLVNDADKIKVEMTTNSSCATQPKVDSREILMSVSPLVIPSISISASGKTTLCPGESVELYLDQESNVGTAVYQWKKDGVNISGATNTSYLAKSSGIYILEVSSSLKCITESTIESASIVINQSVLSAVSISSAKTEICSYETLTLNSNLIVKDWVKDVNVISGAGGSNSLDTKTSGSYFAIYENADGCLDSSNVLIISQIPGSNIVLSPASPEVCVGGTVLIESSVSNPNYTYIWFDENNSPIKQGAESTYEAGAGSYTLLVDNGTCKDTSNTVLVVEKVLSTPVIVGDQTPLCNATNVSYSVNNASASSTYTWTVPTGAAIILGQGTNQILVDLGDQDGNITVTESVSGNCSGLTAELLVSLQKCDLKVDFTVDNVRVCSGGEVIFANASSGVSSSATYSWEFGANAVPATATGAGPHLVTYTGSGKISPKLSIVDGLEIEKIKTNYITINSLPAKPVIVGPSTICLGASVNYTTNSTGYLTWSFNGDQVEFGLNKSTYDVVANTAGNALIELLVEDGWGCQSEIAQKTVSVVDAPTVSIEASSYVVCNNAAEVITLTGATGAIEWFKDGIKIPHANETKLSITSGGSYYASVHGTCYLNTEVLVINGSDFRVDAGSDLIVDIDESVQLNAIATHPVVSYFWTPTLAPIGNPVFFPVGSNEYIVTVVSNEGCVASDEVMVTVVRPLFIPNAFTPNGDGNHDVWEVTGLERYGNDVTVSIFNRWGAIVYQAKGAYFQWDGRNRGSDMPVATYYYVIELGGDREPITGSVLLSK